MDINEYKKYAIPLIEAGKMVNIVKKAIKQAEYNKHDKDEEQKEIFKPITQELKKEIDEISDLREEIIKVNKPITFNPEQKALTEEKGLEEQKFANLDAGFTDKDKDVLERYELPYPSDLFLESLNDDEVVDDILKTTSKLNKKLGLDKAHISQTKSRRQKNKDKIDELSDAIEIIKKYRLRIGFIREGKKTLQSGKGYNQKKRNAYKIDKKTGQYGNLTIDLPKLFGQLKLIAYKDGKKIYDKKIDFDTLDLFTKRYNAKKKYTSLSRSVFNDINKLSEIPIHKTSKNFKKIGSGVVYYNNGKDLFNRLELLGGSIKAGNSSSSLKNEFSEITHVLKKLNFINNDQLKNLLKNYVV